MVFCLFKGADIFCAKVNLEVQRASEAAIAAVERNGGVISTSYYDPRSLGELHSEHMHVNVHVAWSQLTFLINVSWWLSSWIILDHEQLIYQLLPSTMMHFVS